jgi:hypothetical protein
MLGLHLHVRCRVLLHSFLSIQDIFLRKIRRQRLPQERSKWTHSSWWCKRMPTTFFAAALSPRASGCILTIVCIKNWLPSWKWIVLDGQAISDLSYEIVVYKACLRPYFSVYLPCGNPWTTRTTTVRLQCFFFVSADKLMLQSLVLLHYCCY